MQALIDCCSIIGLGSELLTEEEPKVDLQAGTIANVECGTGCVSKSAGRTAYRLLNKLVGHGRHCHGCVTTALGAKQNSWSV